MATVQEIPGVQFNRLPYSAAQTGFTHEIVINYDDPKLQARTTAGNVIYDFDKVPQSAVKNALLYNPVAFAGTGVTAAFVQFGVAATNNASAGMFIATGTDLTETAPNFRSGVTTGNYLGLGSSASLRVTVSTSGAGPSALTAGRAIILFRLVDLDLFND